MGTGFALCLLGLVACTPSGAASDVLVDPAGDVVSNTGLAIPAVDFPELDIVRVVFNDGTPGILNVEMQVRELDSPHTSDRRYWTYNIFWSESASSLQDQWFSVSWSVDPGEQPGTEGSFIIRQGAIAQVAESVDVAFSVENSTITWPIPREWLPQPAPGETYKILEVHARAHYASVVQWYDDQGGSTQTPYDAYTPWAAAQPSPTPAPTAAPGSNDVPLPAFLAVAAVAVAAMRSRRA